MGGYSVYSVLLLLVNFVSGFRLEFMYISLIVSIRSSFTHLDGFELLVLLPYFIEIPFFVCTNRINLLNLTESSDRLVIVAKGFLKLPKLRMLIKQKIPSPPRNLALGTFGELLSVLDKRKSTIPPVFNGPGVLPSASDKPKLFAKNFTKNSDLDDLGISLFSSRTNLKLHKFSIAPKMALTHQRCLVLIVFQWWF